MTVGTSGASKLAKPDPASGPAVSETSSPAGHQEHVTRAHVAAFLGDASSERGLVGVLTWWLTTSPCLTPSSLLGTLPTAAGLNGHSQVQKDAQGHQRMHGDTRGCSETPSNKPGNVRGRLSRELQVVCMPAFPKSPL